MVVLLFLIENNTKNKLFWDIALFFILKNIFLWICIDKSIKNKETRLLVAKNRKETYKNNYVKK